MKRTIGIIVATAALGIAGVACSTSSEKAKPPDTFDQRTTETVKPSGSAPVPTPPTTQYVIPPQVTSPPWPAYAEEAFWTSFHAGAPASFHGSRECVLNVVETAYPNPLDLPQAGDPEITDISLEVLRTCG